MASEAVQRLPSPIRSAGRFAADVGRGANDDRVTGLAAEVAFFGFLSLVPALIASAAALTLVPRFGDGTSANVEETVIGWLQGLLTESGSEVVDATRDLFDRSNGDVFSIAVVVALWSGSRGVDAVVQAIVQVSNHVERRKWWRRRLISLGLLLATVLSGVVTVSMFVVGPLLGGARSLTETFGFGSAFLVAWQWFRLPLAGAALVGWALLVLHVARPHARAWRVDLPGAVVTAVLWLLASAGLRVYVGTIGRSNPALGALGGPVIVLLWFYLLAAALLVGAEISQQVQERRTASPAIDP